MKIGELTARTGCPAETIRFYEAEGLLQAPERASNNYREYGEEHVSRVSFVMRCRSLDMAHDEIRVLLRLQDEPGTPCDEVRAMLNEHANHVDARIAELSALKEQIQQIRDACADGECIGACGALESLRRTTGANPPPRGHVRGVHR